MQITPSVENLNFQADSTLKDLPSWQVNVEVSLPSETLAQMFAQEPLMPGVILSENSRYVGMISRRVFFEFMSRKYSLGLFAGKAIASLFNFLNPEILTIPAATLITTATQMALGRGDNWVYEPLVIQVGTGQNRIISVQQLLLAHAQIHEQTLVQLQTVREESQRRAAGLQELQQNYALTMHRQIQRAIDTFSHGMTQQIKNPTNAIAGSMQRSLRYAGDLLNLIRLYQKNYPQPPIEIQTATNRINLDKLANDVTKVTHTSKANIKAIQNCLYHLDYLTIAPNPAAKLFDIHDALEGVLSLFLHRFKHQQISLVKQYADIPPSKCVVGSFSYALFYLFEYIVSNLEQQQTHPLNLKIQTEWQAGAEIIIKIQYTSAKRSQNLTKLENSFVDELELIISNYLICEHNQGRFQHLLLENQAHEYILTLPL